MTIDEYNKRVFSGTQRAAAVPASAVQRLWLSAVSLAALLVAYNNVLFLLPSSFALPPLWLLALRALALPALAVAWAVRFHGFAPTDLGLASRGLIRGVALGLAAAAVVSLPAVLYFAFPLGVNGGSIDYERAADDSAGEFVYWALVKYPLSAVFLEEVLFRGVLQSLAARALGLVRGVGLTALAFSLWHVVVNYETMSDSNAADSDVFFAFAQVGALVALFGGGVILSVLRLRTGSLAAPITLHWLAVAAMRGALFALSR